uniref:Uncharacterized protein n=1 Tax=Rhizophora mucronata TaxID=61149 RepID=A0A2P2Q3V8_RHIMU
MRVTALLGSLLDMLLCSATLFDCLFDQFFGPVSLKLKNLSLLLLLVTTVHIHAIIILVSSRWHSRVKLPNFHGVTDSSCFHCICSSYCMPVDIFHNKSPPPHLPP